MRARADARELADLLASCPRSIQWHKRFWRMLLRRRRRIIVRVRGAQALVRLLQCGPRPACRHVAGGPPPQVCVCVCARARVREFQCVCVLAVANTHTLRASARAKCGPASVYRTAPALSTAAGSAECSYTQTQSGARIHHLCMCRASGQALTGSYTQAH